MSISDGHRRHVAELHREVHELRPRLEVGRLELDQAAVHAHGLLRLLGAQEPVRERDQLLAPLDDQPLFEVEIGEPLVGLGAAGIEAVDLLVDGDRLQEEAVLGEVLGDALVDLDRFRDPRDPDEEVAEAVQRVRVARGLVHRALVLLDRGVELAARGEFLRFLDDLIPLHRRHRKV